MVNWAKIESGSSLPTDDPFWDTLSGDPSLVTAGHGGETPSGDGVYLSVNDDTHEDKIKIRNTMLLNGGGSTTRVVLRLHAGTSFGDYGFQATDQMGQMTVTFRKTRNGDIGYVSLDDGGVEAAVRDITAWHVYWFVHAPDNMTYLWIDPDGAESDLRSADLIARGGSRTGNVLTWGTETSDQITHYDVDEARWALGVFPPGDEEQAVHVPPDPPPPEPTGYLPLTVMTYNTGAGAGVPYGPEQVLQIANEIKDAGADLVGMSEVEINTDWHGYRDLVAEIDDALSSIGHPMEHFWVQTFSARWHEGMIVIVLWSRFPILDTEYEQTARTLDGDTKIARIEVEPAPGVRVHVFMQHYWTGAGNDFRSQTDEGLELYRAFAGPRIMTGDFNFAPNSSYHRDYLNVGLIDPCQTLPGSDCLTVGDRAGVVAPERIGQIDYIMVSPDIRPTWIGAGPTTMSDHWPLIAHVEVPRFATSVRHWDVR